MWIIFILGCLVLNRPLIPQQFSQAQPCSPPCGEGTQLLHNPGFLSPGRTALSKMPNWAQPPCWGDTSQSISAVQDSSIKSWGWKKKSLNQHIFCPRVPKLLLLTQRAAGGTDKARGGRASPPTGKYFHFFKGSTLPPLYYSREKWFTEPESSQSLGTSVFPQKKRFVPCKAAQLISQLTLKW